MYFTIEDIKQIEQILLHRVIKDTDFNKAGDFNGSELIPIVQDFENKIATFKDLTKEIALANMSDIYNVSAGHDLYETTLSVAASMVPLRARKLGLIITYEDEHGDWKLYQFSGKSLHQWNDLSCWMDLIQLSVSQYLADSDEEDITKVKSEDKSILKFKNKKYNKDEFSGLGRIYLRKNLVGTEGCSVDDEDHCTNVLNQGMISLSNTIYIIQYDYDLQDKEIIIPDNCILSFQGGSFKNGSIRLNNTRILGVKSYNEIGGAQVSGNPYVGQIMLFEESDADFAGRLTGPDNTWNSPKIYWWNGVKWNPIASNSGVVDVSSELSKIKASIQKVGADLDSAKEECSTKINSVKSELSGEITSLKEKTSSNTAKVDSLKDEVSGIKNKVAENTASIEQTTQDLTSRIGAVEDKAFNNANSINEVCSKIATVEFNVSNNSSKIADIQVVNTNQDAAIKKVTDDFAEYKNDNPHPCNAIVIGNSIGIPTDNNGIITLPEMAKLSEISVKRGPAGTPNSDVLKNYTLSESSGVIDLRQFVYGTREVPIIILSGQVQYIARDNVWKFSGSIHPGLSIKKIQTNSADLIIELENCKIISAYTSSLRSGSALPVKYINAVAGNYIHTASIRVSDYKFVLESGGNITFIKDDAGVFKKSNPNSMVFDLIVVGWVNE